mgnify:CR=1 FL=1
MALKSFYEVDEETTATSLTVKNTVIALLQAAIFFAAMVAALFGIFCLFLFAFKKVTSMKNALTQSAWTVLACFVLIYFLILLYGLFCGFILRWLKTKVKASHFGQDYIRKESAYLAAQAQEEIAKQLKEEDKDKKWTIFTESYRFEKTASLPLYSLVVLAAWAAFIPLNDVAKLCSWAYIHYANFALLLAFISIVATKHCNEATLLPLLSLLAIGYLQKSGIPSITGSYYPITLWPYVASCLVLSTIILYRIFLTWKKSKTKRFLLTSGGKCLLAKNTAKGWQLLDASYIEGGQTLSGYSGFSFELELPNEQTTRFQVETLAELEAIANRGMTGLPTKKEAYVARKALKTEWKAISVCALAWGLVAVPILEVSMVFVLFQKPLEAWSELDYEPVKEMSKEFVKVFPNSAWPAMLNSHYEFVKGDYEKAIASLRKAEACVYGANTVHSFITQFFDGTTSAFLADWENLDETLAKEKTPLGKDDVAFRHFRKAQSILALYDKHGPRFPRPDSLRQMLLQPAHKAYQMTKGNWVEPTILYIEILGTLASSALIPTFSNEPAKVKAQIEEALKVLETEKDNLSANKYLSLKARLLLRQERFAEVVKLLAGNEVAELKTLRISAGRHCGHTKSSSINELDETDSSQRKLKAILLAESGRFDEAWSLLRASSTADQCAYRARLIEALLGDQLLPAYWQSSVARPITMARVTGVKRDEFKEGNEHPLTKKRLKKIPYAMDIFSQWHKRRIFTLQWEKWMIAADIEYMIGLAQQAAQDSKEYDLVSVYNKTWDIKRDSPFKRLSELSWYRYRDRANSQLKSL